jgi:hypothetical protein
MSVECRCKRRKRPMWQAPPGSMAGEASGAGARGGTCRARMAKRVRRSRARSPLYAQKISEPVAKKLTNSGVSRQRATSVF